MSEGARPDPRRVEELFDEVCDLDPEAAARRLDALAAGDLALRAAVDRLLAHDREAASFLAKPAALLAEAFEDTVLDTGNRGGAAEGPGRAGRFYLLRKLGEGGMGVVFVGYDEALDRKVAIKLLRLGAAARAWLHREGQALARLAHPNVVAVHEIGEHEGRVFLAMELVEGPTLRAWLAERERPFRDVIGMFTEAGRGLAAAHAAGLVHRDFKPDNVLVGKDGRARVVDFGISGLADETVEAIVAPAAARGDRPSASPSALSSPLTQTGALMGTPAFMSPEQIRGERATAASDQFAFAVSLWRAAYGAPPFATDDLALLLKAALEETPTPPRRTDAPAWLAPILLRALAKDPSARFASIEAMLAEIERYVPRDAAHDPELIRRERRALAGVMFLGTIVIWSFAFLRASQHVAMSSLDLVRVALGLVIAAIVAVVLLRRAIAANQHGRRMASLIVASVVGMLLHRLVAMRFAMPVPQVLAVDAVMLAMVSGIAAVTLERWIVWLAGLALAAAAIISLAPAWALQAFALMGFGTTTAMLIVWSRRA